tara:strand:- start:422 stop:568 length:147 start_codon:yes stop_codon:yes gene_type:complete
MESHVWFVAGICGIVLVLLAAMGIHLKTVELPRRAKSLVKERILDKAA